MSNPSNKNNGWKEPLRHKIAYAVWETKDDLFWVALQVMLHSVKPKCLFEFGSGRSTYYQAEYSKYTGATFLSFEQNRFFMYRYMIGAYMAFLPVRDHIRHLPIIGKDKGYRADIFRRIVQKDLQAGQKADFLFVDGPGGDEGRALRFFKPFESRFGDIKLAIVDDVNRQNSFEVAEWIKDTWGLNQCTFRYGRAAAKLAILSTMPIEKLLESSCKNLMVDFKSKSSNEK